MKGIGRTSISWAAVGADKSADELKCAWIFLMGMIRTSSVLVLGDFEII